MAPATKTADERGDRDERAQQTATDYAVAELRALLISGELAPGTRIDQAKLAEGLGVSLVPIREALGRLQSAGLVEIVPHRGVFVSSVSADELVDIYTVREILEEQAARLAVSRLSTEEVDALARLANAMATAVKAKDHGRLLEHNRELHFTIYRAAGRHHMLQVIERLWDLSARYAHMQLRAVPERPAQAMFEVRRIVEACRRRDGDALALMLRYKLHQTRVEVLERLQLGNLVSLSTVPSDRAEPRAKRRASGGRRAARAVSR
jgi:DNA-binding GntR family transcriptional regulator